MYRQWRGLKRLVSDTNGGTDLSSDSSSLASDGSRVDYNLISIALCARTLLVGEIGGFLRCLDLVTAVFNYRGSDIFAIPSSAWWVVHCTGWVVSVFSFVVWEVYDLFRLWWISPRFRVAMKRFGPNLLRLLLGEGRLKDCCHFDQAMEGRD